MTTRFPLAPDDGTGVPRVIKSPDTIDPSILPVTTSTFQVDGGSATVPGNYAGTLQIDFGGAT